MLEATRRPGWRGLLIPAVFLLTFLSVITPIAAALLIARHQSFVAGRERVHWLASEAVRRADTIRRQIGSARKKLEARPTYAPCSGEGISRMAGTVLEYEQLQGMGYVSHGRLVCTNAGPQHPPIPLGRPDFVTVDGAEIFHDVKLFMAPGTRLILVGAASGYTFFIHPTLSLDIPLANDREALGVIGLSHRSLINGKGAIDTRLLDPFYRAGRTSYIIENRMIAVVRSRVGDVAGFAALPMDEIHSGMGRYLLYLVPVGLLCGLGLIFLLRLVVRSETSMATVARRALRTDQFFLCYQPLVELETGRWVGAEALVRWRRPTGEEVRPDLFIPYLEEAGLIPQLTDKVIEMLASDVADGLKGLHDFHISINVAAVDLHRDRLMGLIETLASRTGCEARRFVLETSERGLIDAEDGGRALKAARDRGVRVALDDFGTGYSSLAYLQTFPLDIIKIDKSFVDSIATGAAIGSVIVHIINMAKDLKLGLIAEGVETEEQARFLAERGVAYGQGWLFARPMPWAELLKGIEARQARHGSLPHVARDAHP